MPNGGPWKRERGDVAAVLERLEHQTVGFCRVETVDPHALDLGRYLRVVIADPDGPLEGGKGVPVNGCSCWAIDELVERVALSPVGKLSPSLCKVSMVFGVEKD
jgi:hypothetical protein